MWSTVLTTNQWNWLSKFIASTLLLVVIQSGYAQIITGSVTDESGNPVVYGVAFLCRCDDPSKILQFKAFRADGFRFEPTGASYDFCVIIKAQGYQPDTLSIGSNRQLIVKLRKLVPSELQEVVVVTKSPPFSVKKDTVSYKIKPYSDGSETKLEDILRKLPGIKVDRSTGRISYKGKAIETITIDGDDLFGQDYTVGSRNIDVDLVSEVQAIENYSSNPLLQGINDEGKVALNLKMNKKLLDLTAEAEVGAGAIEERRIAKDGVLTILGLSKGVKSFGIISDNNLGIDRSPLQYYLPQGDAVLAKQKLISDSVAFIQLERNGLIKNNQLFADGNTLVDLSQQTSLKINSIVLGDVVDFMKESLSMYRFGEQELTNWDRNLSNKRGTITKNDISLTTFLSKKGRLQFGFKQYGEGFDTESLIQANSDRHGETKVDTGTRMSAFTVGYTNRLAERWALQMEGMYDNSSLMQNLQISGLTIYDGVQRTDAHYVSDYFELKLLGVSENSKTKFLLSIKYGSTEQRFASGFSLPSGSVESQSNAEYSSEILTSTQRIAFLKGPWKFNFENKLSTLKQRLFVRSSEANLSAVRFLLEPTFSIARKWPKVSSAIFMVRMSQKPLGSDYLFDMPVWTDNRTNVVSVPTTACSKTVAANLQFMHNDLYNQVQVSSGITCQKAVGSMVGNYTIGENATEISYYFKRTANSAVDVNTTASKYLPKWFTTFRLTFNYNYATYNNVVNESALRTNASHGSETDFFAKTTFNFPLNVENETKLRNTIFTGDDGAQFSNTSLLEQVRLLWKSKGGLLSDITFNYFVPSDRNMTNSYPFLDATFRYKPENKPLSVSLTAGNLFNIKDFSSIQTTDVSTSIFRTSLLSRYISIKLGYRF